MTTCRAPCGPSSSSAGVPGWSLPLAQLSLSLSIPAPSEISHCSAVQLKAFLEVLCQEVFQGTGLLFCWKRKASLFLFVI